MAEIVIFLLVLCGIFIFVLLASFFVTEQSIREPVSNFFTKLFSPKLGKEYSNNQQKEVDETEQVPSYVKQQAIKDAENNDYRIRYKGEQASWQDQYDDSYKDTRRKSIKYDAFYDAEKVFLYENNELEYKPFLRGQHLTISAEIAEYQSKFIEEKSRLEDLAEDERTRIRQLSETLNALYQNDHQENISPEQFSSVFQLGETSKEVIVEKKKFSAQSLVNNRSRKGAYQKDHKAIRLAVEHADENKYNNTFKGSAFYDYHIRFFDRRMEHVNVQAKYDAKSDQEDYEIFNKIPIIRRKARKKHTRPMPPYIPAKFNHFAEKAHYINVYKKTMESFEQNNKEQVELVEENISKKRTA